MAASRSRIVLHRIALLAFVALLGSGIALRDKEAIAFAVFVLVGVMLLPLRNGLLGRIVIGLVLLNTAFWMAPAAWSNVRHDASILYVAVPVGLAALAVAGILAAVGVGSRMVPLAVAVVAVCAAAGSQLIGDKTPTQPGDLVLSVKQAKFSRDRLSASAGLVGVQLTNHDLFWHTFTIDDPKVNLRVPVGATHRVTFEAAPGRYEFYCAIPGHKSIGMKGTLVVR